MRNSGGAGGEQFGNDDARTGRGLAVGVHADVLLSVAEAGELFDTFEEFFEFAQKLEFLCRVHARLVGAASWNSQVFFGGVLAQRARAA